MKILCVKSDSSYFFELTEDKWYECHKEDVNLYWIINNDFGYEEWYPKSLFITEKECRRLKLNKLNEI